MHFKIALAFASLVAAVSAYTCTEGVSWTPDEFAEYLTLNDTTDWEPMGRVKNCKIDAADVEAANISAVERRGGNNQFNAYSGFNCDGYNFMFEVKNFGCGGCYSVSSAIQSGWLWRQTTGNPYPTVDFFDAPNCRGSKIHHQGISSGQYSSCNNVANAWSVAVYQGC
ncbi:hypothetical protein CH35J_007515 [Colletotrichum higginsianum]|uniref:Secreted protein n=1 Tax=Colletotrichum higginsianum TaxID=80884 RepID=A0A4T0VYC4_9PEZI|nr:hypothetical protein CH35J_007515 [Colletotrichum higginsianum]